VHAVAAERYAPRADDVLRPLDRAGSGQARAGTQIDEGEGARRAGRALLAGLAGRAVLAGVTLRSLETLRPLGTVEQRAAREVAPLQRPSLTLAELTAFRLDLRCGDRALFNCFVPTLLAGKATAA
jgi:hypothetical protein